ncbi:MAG: NifU family protein [Hyphomicrobiales bacterium]
MFIQTEATPNPTTLKFLPGETVLASDTRDYRSADGAGDSPFAQKLFSIDGVEAVFFGSDFISITKADVEWAHIKPAILGAIMEHFMSGQPVVTGAENTSAEGDGEFFEEEDAGTVKVIKELLDTRVRPAVANDGGDITFQGFRDGVVFLHMRGACAGCPSSTATLKHGIENLLRHFVPDVQEVRPVA